MVSNRGLEPQPVLPKGLGLGSDQLGLLGKGRAVEEHPPAVLHEALGEAGMLGDLLAEVGQPGRGLAGEPGRGHVVVGPLPLPVAVVHGDVVRVGLAGTEEPEPEEVAREGVEGVVADRAVGVGSYRISECFVGRQGLIGAEVDL